MTNAQIYGSLFFIIAGILVIIFKNFIADKIPTAYVSIAAKSKSTGKKLTMESNSQFFGKEAGRKRILIMGVLFIITGLTILIYNIFI